MHRIAGNAPSPLGDAMLSCKCWLSGFEYSTSRSIFTSSAARRLLAVNNAAARAARQSQFRLIDLIRVPLNSTGSIQAGILTAYRNGVLTFDSKHDFLIQKL